MASPIGAGSVLPCGLVLPPSGSTGLPARPGPLEAGISGVPGPVVPGQLLPAGLGVEPLAMQLARLSRYQQAAAAACYMSGNTLHQSPAGHLLTYLYARQQQQQQRIQQNRVQVNSGDGCSIFQVQNSAHHQVEEPKPNHSYIGIIAMAILGSKERKLVLSDIYQWILDNYPYFRRRGPGWRNSIRHNLSLNDCFVKAGRSANGKGHYWAIHPANVDDFERGDFRRRRAQRKVRRAMGLAVADDDDDSPVPSPSTPAIQSTVWPPLSQLRPSTHPPISPPGTEPLELRAPKETTNPPMFHHPLRNPVPVGRKRLFDVESLLAPDSHKMAADKPEIDSTTESHICRDREFLFMPIQRKRFATPPSDDVITGTRQPLVCDNDVTTTSGFADKAIIDDEVEIVTSVNPLPLATMGDRDEGKTGRTISPCHRSIDVETVSGERGDAELKNFWLHHSKSFLQLPVSACHVTRTDMLLARNPYQGPRDGPANLVKSREISSPVRDNIPSVN